MNNKNRNKNIRKNILQLVADRLNPYNPNLKFSNTSCHTCLTQHGVSDTENHKQHNYKMSEGNAKQRTQNKLKIYSKIYELAIQTQQWSQLRIMTLKSSGLDCAVMKKSKQGRKGEQKKQGGLSEQRIRNIIKEWVLYAMRTHNRERKERKKILPLDQHEDMQRLKQMIEQRSTFHKLELPQNLFVESQHFPVQNQSQLKLQNKQSLSSTVVPYSSFAFNNELLEENENGSKNENGNENGKTYSLKLFESHATLPSQKESRMNKIKEEHNNNGSLLRMVALQAQCLQHLL